MSHQRLEKLSQTGTIAATILRDIADVTSASYLKAVASLAVSIFDTVEVRWKESQLVQSGMFTSGGF